MRYCLSKAVAHNSSKAVAHISTKEVAHSISKAVAAHSISKALAVVARQRNAVVRKKQGSSIQPHSIEAVANRPSQDDTDAPLLTTSWSGTGGAGTTLSVTKARALRPCRL